MSLSKIAVRTLTFSRFLTTAAHTAGKQKEEGTIASAFASLSGDADLGAQLPSRFADLKSSFVSSPEHAAALTKAWTSVLAALKPAVAAVAANRDTSIPTINYPENVELAKQPLSAWVSPTQLENIKYRGVAVIKGVVPRQQALEWKSRFQEYANANPNMKGFPTENKQVFEAYWSKSQIEARAHPNLLNTTTSFLNLFNASHQNKGHILSADRAISLNNPLVYADRLRIRHPGDSKFALGPHIDGGGIERWEDPTFKRFFKRILESDCDWLTHDPWSLCDNGERLVAQTDLYQGAGQCSVFRPFQGWLSLSHTKKNEGTLRVLPLLREVTAYIILRPFFRPIVEETPSSKESPLYSEEYLSSDNWVFDPTTSAFPGCSLGRNIELNNVTHPHLQLQSTMTSVPEVAPGDMVFWHTDVVHSVESQHRGKGDSSVMYIPAVPLTKGNWEYVKAQREAFAQGIPPADFPGGEGERGFVGRAGESDIVGETARRAMGLQVFDEASAGCALERELIRQVNADL